jgi:hypothetical protein
MRVLSANPVVFAIATLIGLTGPVSPLLFFLSYRDAIPILFVASIVLQSGLVIQEEALLPL